MFLKHLVALKVLSDFLLPIWTTLYAFPKLFLKLAHLSCFYFYMRMTRTLNFAFSSNGHFSFLKDIHALNYFLNRSLHQWCFFFTTVFVWEITGFFYEPPILHFCYLNITCKDSILQHALESFLKKKFLSYVSNLSEKCTPVFFFFILLLLTKIFLIQVLYVHYYRVALKVISWTRTNAQLRIKSRLTTSVFFTSSLVNHWSPKCVLFSV